MAARWWHRFRVARRTAIGLAVLAFLAFLACVSGYGAVRRASSIVNRLLREWAVETIAEQSRSAYQLEIGHVRFDWALRRVAVDSIRVLTRDTVNAQRPQSLPGLQLALYSCTISGVQVVTLVRNGGLIAASFGCRRGILAVEVPRRAPTRDCGAHFASLVQTAGLNTSSFGCRRIPAVDVPRPVYAGDPAGHTPGGRQAFLVFQQGVRLPSYAPRIRIDRIVFPRLALDIGLPSRARGVTRLVLGRLQWNMTDLVIDPADTAAAGRPLFSRTIELAAHNFTTRPGRASALSVGRLQMSLTDSTLELHGVSLKPDADRTGFTGQRRYRQEVMNLAVAQLSAQGIDFGAFILGQGIRARRIEVDSFRIGVTSDKRLLVGPAGPPHRTPQQWIADLDETLILDSLRLRNGELVYREHAPGREQPGVFTFSRIDVAGANVTHFVGRRTSSDPMTLTARAHIQGAGRLDVRAVVPLDAPRFDMTLRGTLGAMSVPLLNPFVVETKALQIESGQLAGVAFSVGVRNGVAIGTITPRFNDLSISVTRDGSKGILGGGGVFGGAARGIANVASGMMVRANNPAKPASAPRIGAIGHTFTPDETLVGFFWTGVRDGLLSVVKR